MKMVLPALLVLGLAACSQAPQPNAGSAPASTSSMATAVAATLAVPPASTDAAVANAAAMLTQYQWRLTAATDKVGQRIDVLSARADKPLQLDFDVRGLSVSNTCNRMHGGYSVADGKLEIGQLASTLMACPDQKLMALDAAAGKYLSGTLAFSLDTGNAEPELTLTTARDDKLAFTGAPTAETRFGNAGETVFLEVAPDTEPCNNPGMPNAQCLEVRELHYDDKGLRSGQPGPWQVLGQSIQGFTHQPGTRNVLRVKRYKIANPPADASSVAYVLDMVVESETTR